jgi:hypothetical protein
LWYRCHCSTLHGLVTNTVVKLFISSSQIQLLNSSWACHEYSQVFNSSWACHEYRC